MVTEKLEKKVSEGEFIKATRAAAKELGFKVKKDEIFKRKEKYRIQKLKEEEHKYGEGGHRLNSILLYEVNKKQEKKVLEVRNYASWTTLSDDSDDYPDIEKNSVTLYLEDKLARAVFEKLKC